MNKFVPSILILVTLASWTSLNAQELRRVALVIGNSEYPTARLVNPVNDAAAVDGALKSIGFSVTKQINRSKTQMEADIDSVTRDLDKGDVCFIFFAGHGIQLEDSNYLIPIDAQVSRSHHVKERCVSLGYLMTAMEDSDASLKVVILDCCRDNPFRSFFRNEKNGLAGVQAPEGTVIAFSTAAGQVAKDGDGKNSPFTKHFVETISSKPIDGLTLFNLFRQTARSVRSEENQRAFVNWDVSMDEYFVIPPTKPTLAVGGNSGEKPNVANAAKMDAEKGKPLAGSNPVDPFNMNVDKVPNKIPNNNPTSSASLTNSIGMKLNLIPAGKFMMGSPASEEGREDDEFQHEVEITKSFYMGTFEVTRGQFAQFVKDANYKTEAEKGEGGYGWNDKENKYEGYDPKYNWRSSGFTQTDSHPVVNVSWNDAVEFCKWLSKKEGKTYRLPTEAEWEYACRGGNDAMYHFGGDAKILDQFGNFADMSIKPKLDKAGYTWSDESANDGAEFTSAIGRYSPNDFGLYDMHGNVWEWCNDWYNDDYYKTSPLRDPKGASAGSSRVLRGGSWFVGATFCRSAVRYRDDPSSRGGNGGGGFRVVVVR